MFLGHTLDVRKRNYYDVHLGMLSPGKVKE